ncbi:MAG: tetratricopeptide repeat protein [Armatimonadetes bacterium]|nr:tetratricopeptide repeat protein [Armatimonadota bacterium]
MSQQETSRQIEITQLLEKAAQLRYSDNEAARRLAATALLKASATGNERGMAHAERELGIAHFLHGEFAKALRCYHHALELQESLGNQNGIAVLLNDIGAVQTELGNYRGAMEYFVRSLELRRQQGAEPLTEASVLMSIGNLHTELGNPAEALRCFTEALHTGQAARNERLIAIASNNIGLAYQYLGSYTPALEYYHASLALCRKANNRQSEGDALHNIGFCHYQLQQYAEATAHLTQSLHLRRSIGDAYGQMKDLCILGLIHRAEGNHAKAVQCQRQGLTIAKAIEANRDLYEIHRTLCELLKERRRYAEALWHHEEYHRLFNQVFSEENQRNLGKLTLQQQLEREQHEKEVLRLKNEQLELLMRHRENELSGMALQLVQKNELIEWFKSEMRTILQQARENVRELGETLLSEINQRTRDDGQWELFHQKLAETQHDFVRNLARQFPSLTPTELRICSLLKINLASKEIANILHLSIETIAAHRHHIRKKIGLDEATDLASSLQKFDAQQAETTTQTEDPETAKRFATLHPSLSMMEVKVCVLLRHNLSTKEIAKLLNCSERTIENHRYRIRRKLGLGADVNLTTVIAAL